MTSFQLYESVTTQLLNHMATLDEAALVWNCGYTIPFNHPGVPDQRFREVCISQPWRTKSRNCDLARAIIQAMNKRPIIQQGYGHPAYFPDKDAVILPDRERFHTEEEMYSTVFHELVHATGHRTRLNRPKISAVFNDSAVHDLATAVDEVMTELATALLCAQAGILDAPIKNSAAYIHSWSTFLNPENTACAVFDALPAAQKACEYILGTKAA